METFIIAVIYQYILELDQLIFSCYAVIHTHWVCSCLSTKPTHI